MKITIKKINIENEQLLKASYHLKYFNLEPKENFSCVNINIKTKHKTLKEILLLLLGYKCLI